MTEESLPVEWDDDLAFDPRPKLSVNGRPSAQRVPLMKINARRDTCRTIINAIGGASVLGPQTGVRWRGQGSMSWRVASGATRSGITGDALVEHERRMIAVGRRIGMDNAQHLGDWEILARFRHNGAATRLIDITTDPFVALFMLCDPVGNAQVLDAEGLLLAVNRSALREIKRPWETGSYELMVTTAQHNALVYTTPPIDPRIAAQRGEFMLSSHPLPAHQARECELFPITKPPGWTRNNLEKTLGDRQLTGKAGKPQRSFPTLLGIRVPAEVKPMLSQMLERNFGFTRETIYPDWAGLAETFKKPATRESPPGV